MADFVLSRKKAFTFALDDDGSKVYELPHPSSLSFECVQMLKNIGDESDFVKNGNTLKEFILCNAPELADKGLADMDYMQIGNAYIKAYSDNMGES